MKKIRVGIIGCGRIAERRHAPEYHKNPYSEIRGVYDAREEKAAALAARYGGLVYETAEELLGDPGIDAVSICAANNAHAELTIKALNAGKHVLVEKPMAMTVEDCYAMLEAAKASGKLLMVGQNQRFNTGHVRAKELIEQGIIGKPLTFKTTFGHGGPERWIAEPGEKPGKINRDIWFFDRKIASMGAMADLGIHKTDLIQYLLGDKIVSVSAKIMTLDKKTSSGDLIELEDNAILIYTMASGVVGTMTVSWTYYGEEDNSTVIFGTKGVMRLYDNSTHTIQINTDRGDHIYYDLDTMMTNVEQLESGVIREFVEEIRTGNWANAAGEMEVNAIRAILAGFESSREDKTIVLSDFKPLPSDSQPGQIDSDSE